MKKKKFHIDNDWLNRALNYGATQSHFIYLNPNSYTEGFPHLLAFGSRYVKATSNCFSKLEAFRQRSNYPLFGYLSYDLKNEVENLHSKNTNYTKFDLTSFFEAETIVQFISSTEIEIFSTDPDKIIATISKSPDHTIHDIEPITFETRTSKEDYKQYFEQIRQHIIEGDIYEMNYCIEFHKNQTTIDPINTYLALNKNTPAPFSALFKANDHWVISASPERYLKGNEKHVFSQPMKGTIKRSENQQQDKKLREQLQSSEKERAENLMIVDLVRHDLTYHAQPGTVTVDELFGTYTFPKVHQMVSTISMKPKTHTSPLDIIQKSFPMGSMTGAPKIKAMELIDKYENYQRNIYSGAIGYLDLDGSFEFNVLIRSLFYNQTNEYLSYSAGSAITYDANAEEEYNECLLKAKSITYCFSK